MTSSWSADKCPRLTLCEKFHIISPAQCAVSGRSRKWRPPMSHFCTQPVSSRLLVRASRSLAESRRALERGTSPPNTRGCDTMSQLFHRNTNIYSTSEYRRGPGVSRLPRRGRRHAVCVRVSHRASRLRRATDSVQPRAPRRRHGHRLPLLPYVGRGVRVRQHPADQDLHELPLADLEQRADSRAGPRQLPRRQAADRGRASRPCPISCTSITAST